LNEFYTIPQSIECESALLLSRKIIPSAIINYEGLGQCMKYVCDRNSSAEILKEVLENKKLINCNSKTNIGDKLYCEGLFLLVKGVKRLKIDLENLTHTHKAQKTVTKNYTYAEITKPFEHIVNALEKRKQQPSIYT